MKPSLCFFGGLSFKDTYFIVIHYFNFLNMILLNLAPMYANKGFVEFLTF